MDFYDKLLTSIVCVIVTFICIFNTFSFGSSELQKLDGAVLSFSGSIISSQNNSVYYFELDNDYIYNIDFYNCSNFRYAFSNSVELGSTIFDFHDLGNLDSYHLSIDPSSYSYLYFDFSNADSDSFNYNISKSYKYDFSFVINSLVEKVGINNIFDTFEISLPYVFVVVISGFGFYLIFHNIKELSKGREKMN